MAKIIIKHLSGAKANQLETFSLENFTRLDFGRGADSTVKYDPDRDDLVSRQHARLSHSADKNSFILTDLGSRNGTYVNQQRISTETTLRPGDVVQFGPGGPEFLFELDPPLQTEIKMTREARQQQAGATREYAREANGSGAAGYASRSCAAAKQSVGKATVERLISDFQTSSQRTQYSIAAAILGLFILVSGSLFYFISQTKDNLEGALVKAREEIEMQATPVQPNQDGMSVAEIAKKYADSTVHIAHDWKLIHTQSNKQVYQRYVGNGRYPAYLRFDNKIIPWLTTEDEGGSNTRGLIGGRGSGSGFVVSSNGFVLTNAHVAAGSNTIFSQQGFYNPIGSVVFEPKRVEKNGYIHYELPINVKAADGKLYENAELNSLLYRMGNWVPVDETILVDKRESKFLVTNARFATRDALKVLFPNNNNPIPAQLVRLSDTHDVALIKINMMDSVNAVQIEDRRPVPGEEVTVMGYPGGSPEQTVGTESQNPFHPGTRFAQAPNPTVSNGNIGKIIEKGIPLDGAIRHVSDSGFGDSYQLTINSTGSGNSGGPVFDTQGRVIGIFYASGSIGGASVSYALPIQYGKELFSGNKPVISASTTTLSMR